MPAFDPCMSMMREADYVRSFDHYERLADVQMLAMLACIFCEPAATEGISNVLAGTQAAVCTVRDYSVTTLDANTYL
jgi:hypothetical protein